MLTEELFDEVEGLSIKLFVVLDLPNILVKNAVYYKLAQLGESLIVVILTNGKKHANCNNFPKHINCFPPVTKQHEI